MSVATISFPPPSMNDTCKNIFNVLFEPKSHQMTITTPSSAPLSPPDISFFSLQSPKILPSESHQTSYFPTALSPPATPGRSKTDNVFSSVVKPASNCPTESHDIWKLFTRAKDVLGTDGARLENLSWRLMHLNMRKTRSTEQIHIKQIKSMTNGIRQEKLQRKLVLPFEVSDI